MTRRGVTEISYELLPRMEEAGYRARLFQDAARMAFKVIVEPNFGAATGPLEYTIHRVGWEFCPWHDSCVGSVVGTGGLPMHSPIGSDGYTTPSNQPKYGNAEPCLWMH